MDGIIYNATPNIGNAFVGLGIMSLLLAIAFIATAWLMPAKTYMYRKRLIDLYVSGKTRLLATRDGIDLDKEYLTFTKTMKEWRKEQMGLNQAIEADIKDHIEEPIDVSEPNKDYIDFTKK